MRTIGSKNPLFQGDFECLLKLFLKKFVDILLYAENLPIFATPNSNKDR
jgi:hypothetical protein